MQTYLDSVKIIFYTSPTMNRFVVLACCLFAASTATARAEGPRLTLDDCLTLGTARAVALTNAARERTIAETDIRRIRAQTLPALDASASYSRLDEVMRFPGFDLPDNRDQYAAAVTAEQLLYKGGSVRAALRAARSYRIRADEEVRRVAAAVRRDITKAYYDLIYHEEAVQVAAASVEQLAGAEREARSKFESGVLSEFEWLSARVSLANERPALILAEHQRDQARSALRNLLYLDDDDWTVEAVWPEAPVMRDLTVLRSAALTNRWELRQARVYLDVLEADLRVTQGEYLPEIKAFASYGGNDPSQSDLTSDGWDWHWTAGVRATWNLWDGGARGATRIEKGLQREIAADAIIDLERAVDADVENAFRAVQQSLRVLEGARETVTLAEKALNIARARFDSGLGTNLEFTDRNLELNKARIQTLGGLLACHKALADLTYACGEDVEPPPRNEP